MPTTCSFKYAACGDRCLRPNGSSDVYKGRNGDYMNCIDRSLDKHGSKVCHYACLRSSSRTADRVTRSAYHAPVALAQGVYYAGSGRKAPKNRTHPHAAHYGYGFAGGRDQRSSWAKKGSRHGDNAAGLANTMSKLTLVHEKSRGKLLVGGLKIAAGK
tara:strand:- start:37 stop:510 length:474 start_codon:yes stop_codon:yes gene_type:complete